MAPTDPESSPNPHPTAGGIPEPAATPAGRLMPTSPRAMFGIRVSLIVVMAGLLLLTVLAVAYSILTFGKLRDTTTRLAAESLPNLLRAQQIADDLVGLGESLKAARSPATGKERQQRMADIRRWIDRLRAEVDKLATVGQLHVTDEPGAIHVHIARELDALTQALDRFDQILVKRITVTENREVLRQQIREAYAAYVLAVDDANRQMRALVARTLAIDLPAARSEGHLEQRLDAFQDREMSWLGTTQDLRTDGRELNSIAEAAMAASEPAALKALAAQSSTVLLRMTLYKRLPDSPVVHTLAIRTAEFTRFFTGDPRHTPLATRQEELDLERGSIVAFAKLQEIHEDLRRDSGRLVAALGAGTGLAVQHTNRIVDLANRSLLGFSLIAALIALASIRYVIIAKIKRIEGLTASMLQASSEAEHGQQSSLDSRMHAIVRGSGRDEIAAMGEALLTLIEVIAQRDRARALADRAAQETLRALYRASLQLQEPLALNERLAHLPEAARDVLQLDRFIVLLADEEGQWLEAVASLGTTEALEAIRVPIGPEGGGIAQAYLTRQAIVWDGVAPVPEALRLNSPYDQIAAFRSRAFAIVPLIAQGRAIGVLGVDRKHSRQPLDPVTVDLLQLFATQAAIAIENARLHERAQRSAQRVTVLNELTRSLMGSLSPQEVTQKILEAVQILVPKAAITLREREGELLHLRGRAGFEISAERPATLVGRGLAGITAAAAKPMIYEDVSRDPRVIDKTWIERERLVSCAVMPLIFAQQVRGTISIYTRARHRFSEKEINLLQAFADAASIAIENARLYEAVRRHAEELEERVRQRTAELEEALRVKTEFLATMSHELRTPLNPIIGFSELLQQETAGTLTPKQARYVNRIHEGGKRLLELVTAILEVAQGETGTSRLHLESVALGPLVQEVLGVVQDQVTQKQLTVTTSLDCAPPVVVADRGKLSQILAHLVGNAVKFTPEGGRITVRAFQQATGSKQEAAEGTGLPSAFCRLPSLVIEVKDTGIGIRPEDRESIFEAFHQVDGSESRAYGGAGLGLTLVRKLVELHGGRVWAESAGLGRGSRFVVRLPPLELPQ